MSPDPKNGKLWDFKYNIYAMRYSLQFKRMGCFDYFGIWGHILIIFQKYFVNICGCVYKTKTLNSDLLKSKRILIKYC